MCVRVVRLMVPGPRSAEGIRYTAQRRCDQVELALDGARRHAGAGGDLLGGVAFHFRDRNRAAVGILLVVGRARQALQLAPRQAHQPPEVSFPEVQGGDLVARPELLDPVADGAR